MFIITLLYGIFDEVHQIFIPGRYFDLLDLAADTTGVVCGAIFIKFVLLKTIKKVKNTRNKEVR
jgi:VanZ family protein